MVTWLIGIALRMKFKLLLGFLVVMVYLVCTKHSSRAECQFDIDELDRGLQVGAYLINTSTCKIPDIGSFNEGISRFIHKEKFQPCTQIGLLTYINRSNDRTYLKINRTILLQHYGSGVSCCYSNITRSNIHRTDDDIEYSRCVSFEESVQIFYPLVKVVCSNKLRIVAYLNIHFSTLPEKHVNINRVSKNGDKKFSVVIVGIDSISSWNLQRTMPKSHNFLEKHFYNMKGYNKIGENTYPNLMAILTGQNRDNLRRTCDSKTKMNDCDFIWKYFREAGYATAYAEDDTGLSTFNYAATGFQDSPTDYYYRPYAIAAESLQTTVRYKMTQCTGPEHYGVRMLNAAKDFIVNFSNKSIFGLFWMNSFSHDNFNFPSSMDEKVLDFLNDLRRSLGDTIMFFISDHGFRYGDIRCSHRGWLEERLPFVYVYVPDSFKLLHPKKFERFLTNRNRLTTAFDIYLTMQDLLYTGNKTYEPKPSQGCPRCSSLFEEIEENRTCTSASIPQYYCTCDDYNYVESGDPYINDIANFLISEINKLIQSFTEKSLCNEYILDKINSVRMSSHSYGASSRKKYLLMIQATPNAVFEAIVEVQLEKDNNKYSVLGDISRLNRYDSFSYCVSDKTLKKYCICK